jgi:outer membrane protein OmpA-like peptidoglycan-associated protein
MQEAGMRSFAGLESKPVRSKRDAAPARNFAPRSVHEALATPGRSLDPASQQKFGAAFDFDFSRVRIHDDSRSARSADDVGARGYTVGEHIVMGRESNARTLPHELAHVAQQPTASRIPQHLPMGDAHSPEEATARYASDVVTAGGHMRVPPTYGVVALQRDPKPGDPPAGSGDDKGETKKEDPPDPTPWLTLQAQGLLQYSRVYTIPKPPPWMLGAQLGANFQFHGAPNSTGFELALVGQYGRIMTWKSSATATGDQWSGALQPSYLVINTGGTQLSLFGQGGYASTSSSDPSLVGRQFSLLGGIQATQDIVPLGPLKLQVVASLAGGGAWSKGPADDQYSRSGTWQVNAGLQLSWDAVKRRPAPPPQNVEVKVPDEAKLPVEDPKKTDDQQKHTDEAKKTVDQPENKPADNPALPPTPSDATFFFVKDRPARGLGNDKDVLVSGDLKGLKAQIEKALAADPTLKISISGAASVDGPTPEYNCDLGSRRAEWLRRQLNVPTARVADPEPNLLAGACSDSGGLISFGSTKAANTTDESKRAADRYAVVHFHHGK